MRMNFTILLLAVSLIQVSAETFGQRLTYSAENVTLKVVFREITRQTGYDIVYAVANLNEQKTLSVNFDKLPLEQALEVCLQGFPVSYVIQDKTILIKRREQVPAIEGGNAGQAEMSYRQQTISGKVTDALGAPLPGVSVMVKGSALGASSDADGNYELASVPEDAVLVFSFLGFLTLEEAVNGRELINVMLQEDIAGLDEVVVVGYGTQKKTSLTAAVSTIKGEEISSTPVTNLSNGIGGRLPGVIVKQTSGEPGKDGSSIYIRGVSTTGATSPLLIVDGVPRSFQNLDPNTIESFTVLKDAAAVAPYGVAGANGVILVTTKRGKQGAPLLTYNGYVGFQNPTVLPDYVSSYEFATLKNIAAQNDGLPLPYSNYALQKFKDGSDPDAFPVDNVLDYLINKNAALHYHNIEISGGTDKVTYYGSFGYQSQEGMWKTTDADRYNLALSLDAQVSSTTKILLNINGTVRDYKSPPSDHPSLGHSRIFELIGYAHAGRGGPMVFSNGMYGKYVMPAIFESGYNKQNNLGAYSKLSIEQQIPQIPGLSLKGAIAYDPFVNNNKVWTTPLHVASIDTTQRPYVITDAIFGPTEPSLTVLSGQGRQLTYQASLDYQKSFGSHELKLTGVFEAKDNYSWDVMASKRNYSLSIDEINMGSSSNADMNTGGSSSSARQIGLVYRVNYEYAGKYLLEASGRYDGHYYFAPEKRYGFFPAFSAGWRISEEPFIKGRLDWLDNLKLRASYGEVGALAGGPFQYLSTYNVAGPGYAFGGEGVQIVGESSEPNPFITWERAKKTDIGLELSLWKGMFSMELDYFYEKRSNMLSVPDVITPIEYGIGLSQVNAGIMENRGVDLSASYHQSAGDDLEFSLQGTFTFAKNKLLQVFESATTFDNPNRRRTGRPLGTHFGYKSLGYFAASDFNEDGSLKEGIATQPWGQVKPGDIRYQDTNNDGEINTNDAVPIGDPSIPQLIYGFSPSVRFKNFDLNLFFQGAGKTDFYFAKEASWAFWNGMTAHKHNLDYWTPENTDARHPRITSVPATNNTQNSSHWMEDVSYLRLKSFTLSYNLPNPFIERLKMHGARIYLSGQNVLTWSSFKSIDPEIHFDRGNTYPQQKVYSLGINLTF